MMAKSMRLVLGLLALIAGGCATDPSIEVFLIGMTPVQSSLFEQRVRLDLRVQNSGAKELRATGVAVTLNVNDDRLAKGVDNTPFQVPRLGDATTSAVVSTSLFDMARQLLQLPGRDSFSYELKGKIYLEDWGRARRFSRSGELTREQLGRLAGNGGGTPAPLKLE
jgi:hypothetical protein